MARLNVYLPDELAAAARRSGMNVSAVAQEAIRRALDASATDAWLATLGIPPGRTVGHRQALAALDEVRDEAATHHA